MKTEEAIKKLIESLNDPAYYISWQANIAMAFVDQLAENGIKGKFFHNQANLAAKRFFRSINVLRKGLIMKRSEMIRLIVNYLSDYQNWGNELEEASDLLSMIEHSGMLPPPIFKQTTMRKAGYVGNENEMDEITHIASFEWEQE